VNIWVIAKREWGAFLVSPLVYIAGAAFLFVSGLFFVLELVAGSAAALTQVFETMGVLLLGLAPLLAMRLLSEEARSGTLELLLTAPVREGEVVIGKFLAAFLWLMMLLSPTLVYVFLWSSYGNFNSLTVLTGYLGLILLGALVLSVGMLTSAIFVQPWRSAGVGLALMGAWWLAGWLTLTNVSPQPHFFDLACGLGNPTDVIYFLTITTAALFLSICVLAAKRGRRFNIALTSLVFISILAAFYLVILEQKSIQIGRFGLTEAIPLAAPNSLSPRAFCLTSGQMAVTILTTLLLIPAALLMVGGIIWWKRR
jgi:ABC-2 type transport system permease protein